MTSHPAHEIKHEELGNLSQGSVADIAVLRVEKGHYGFTDMQNTRVDGTEKLVAELTIKDGKIVYDLNGMEAKLWNEPLDPNAKYASRWTTFAPRAPDTHNTPGKEMPH
jgi:dihydroorotase